MGMYDTINGDQVKCLTCDLEGYGIGDEIPYKTDDYDYGKNFIILNCGYMDFDMEEYSIHFIKNGKVFASYDDVYHVDEDIDFSEYPVVVDYIGNFLKVRSMKDVYDFIDDKKIFNIRCDRLHYDTNKIWNEIWDIRTERITAKEMGLTNKEEELLKEHKDKLHQLDLKRAEIEPEIKKLDEEFFGKWVENF